jgi:hypothetical protein
MICPVCGEPLEGRDECLCADPDPFDQDNDFAQDR